METSSPLASGTAETSIYDVLIVGAGLSGIGAAYHLQRYCPSKRYVILEARGGLGGTWDLFRYPGVRSDSDMYTLGYSFRPWSQPKSIADGPEVREYIRATARDAGIDRNIRLQHKVVAARWSSAHACWEVDVEKAATARRETFRTRFLYLCSGYYRYDRAYRPTFEGESQFRGEIAIPQFWPEQLDYAGKRIVVVGSGATAVTLVPALAQTAAHVTMLQRSPSYVVSRPQRDELGLKLRRHLPERLAYRLIRWKNVAVQLFFYQLARRRPEFVRRKVLEMAARQLGSDVDATTHFNPSYNPWDQRVCAASDGDLFRALRKKQASIVTDRIRRFIPEGLELESGHVLQADIVVLATGLELNVLGDVRLSVDGRDVVPSATMAYKGMMLSDVPNMAMTFGYTNSSWTLKADLTATYVCRLLRYMERARKDIAVPRREPGVQRRPFLSFSSGYVQRAAHLLPAQGSRRPWQVYQNYFRDLLTIRFGRVADGVMKFGAKGTMP